MTLMAILGGAGALLVAGLYAWGKHQKTQRELERVEKEKAITAQRDTAKELDQRTERTEEVIATQTERLREVEQGHIEANPTDALKKFK